MIRRIRGLSVTQRRWKLAEKIGKLKTTSGQRELKETIGVGLWSSENTSAGVPMSAHHETYKIPPFDYTYERYPKSCSIGIDLGTTNSCVSYLDPDSNQPIIVPIEGQNTCPTIIALKDVETRYFGVEAASFTGRTSDMSVCSGKRLLGKNIYDKNVPKEVYEDVMTLTQGEYGIAVRFTRVEETLDFPNTIRKSGNLSKLSTMEFPVVHIIAMFLRYIKTQAELTTGMNVNAACISVPAHFNDAQRKATEDAAIIAGMDVLEIIDEPSAAALAYKELVAKKEVSGVKRVAVFDLGGGTFDLAILSIDYENGVSKIIASGGDDTLGGDDFDRILIDYWNEELSGLEYEPTLSATFNSRLREEAIKTKINLDTYEEVRTTIPVWIDEIRAEKVPLSITRFEYEQLLQPLIEKMGTCVEETFAKCPGIDPTDVNEIILVGEMTRTPAVQKYIKKRFKKEPVISSVATPGTIVSLGTTLRIKQLASLRQGEEVSGFVYSEDSPQYAKSLPPLQRAAYRAKKYLNKRREWKKMKHRPGEYEALKKMEQGLTDNQIERMSQEVVTNELVMRKKALIKKLQQDYSDLFERIADWKEPRQGFNDDELDELIEILKFWNNVVEKENDKEEYMAQAYWELKAYFDELSGSSEKTAIEEIASNPELFTDTNETESTRIFTKKTSPTEDEDEDEEDIVEAPVRTFSKP